MTKDELKKEAEESADKWIKWAIDHKSLEYWNSYVDGYLASAEPREKRIEQLEQENNKLLDVINNQDVKIAGLEKENAELKKQIEKMKNYLNCENYGKCGNSMGCPCDKWECIEK